MFVVFTTGLVLTACVMTNGELLEYKVVPMELKRHSRVPSFMTERSFELKHSTITTSSIMTYDNVITNVGSNYKPAPSIFITPVNGTYVFYLAASSNYSVELGIFRNNFQFGQVNNDLKSSTVIIELHQGDIVYVKVNSAPENATLSQCRFGGFLVHF